jgi:hypothetical protein
MTTQSPYRTADPLGPVVSEHSVTGVQQVIRIVLGVFTLIVAIDCIWLGVWPRFGEFHLTASIVCGVIALVFFWLSWDAFSQYVKARRQRVVYHDHGVRIHGGKQPHDVRFDDVASVGGMLWESLDNGANAGAVLWIDDVHGTRFELPTPLANTYELGDQIRRQTFEKRRSTAEKRISSGEAAKFGRCSLASLLLVVDGEVIPRSAIEKVKLSSRWLTIKPRGMRERLIPAEQIPDLDVLLSIIEA